MKIRTQVKIISKEKVNQYYCFLGSSRAADSTMRSKTGGRSKQSGRTAIGGWKSGRSKTGGSSSTSKPTESSGGSTRPSARTAYNTSDGDYENLENLKLDWIEERWWNSIFCIRYHPFPLFCYLPIFPLFLLLLLYFHYFPIHCFFFCDQLLCYIMLIIE